MSTCTSYRDFIIRFEELKDDGTYMVRVETDDGSRFPATFFPPGINMPPHMIRMEDPVRGEFLGNSHADIDIGKALYGRLFWGMTGSCLTKRVTIGDVEGFGVRVKICADLNDGMGKVVNLPWEQLNDWFDQYLSHNECTPVVRHLDSKHTSNPVKINGKLRILVAMANPNAEEYRLARLDLETEYEQIEKCFEGSERVVIERLHPVNRVSLRKRLENKDLPPVHVLHFMGHGAFRNNRGKLVFEKNNGDIDWFDATTLSDFVFRYSKEMRLVFLNACNTAVHTEEHPTNAFTGLASSIIKTGMPAVIAMQKPVKDAKAISFAGIFYDKFAQGWSIERAVTAGRTYLYDENTESMDWAIPVLYLRTSDDELFPVNQPNANREKISDVENQKPDSSLQNTMQSIESEEPAMRILVYLICDRKDWDDTQLLYNYLIDKGLEIEYPVFDGDPQVIGEADDDMLEVCDVVILYYGLGSARWKRSVINKLRKIAGMEGRNKPIPKIYTFVAAPVTADKKPLIGKIRPGLLDATKIDLSLLVGADTNKVHEVFNELFADILNDLTT